MRTKHTREFPRLLNKLHQVKLLRRTWTILLKYLSHEKHGSWLVADPSWTNQEPFSLVWKICVRYQVRNGLGIAVLMLSHRLMAYERARKWEEKQSERVSSYAGGGVELDVPSVGPIPQRGPAFGQFGSFATDARRQFAGRFLGAAVGARIAGHIATHCDPSNESMVLDCVPLVLQQPQHGLVIQCCSTFISRSFWVDQLSYS